MKEKEVVLLRLIVINQKWLDMMKGSYFQYFQMKRYWFLIIRFLIMGMLFGYKVEWKVFRKLVLFLLPKFPIWLGMILIIAFRDVALWSWVPK